MKANNMPNEQNETVTVLSVGGNYSTTTRQQLISGLEAKGASVEVFPSRKDDCDLVRANSILVARIFRSEALMLAWQVRGIN